MSWAVYDPRDGVVVARFGSESVAAALCEACPRLEYRPEVRTGELRDRLGLPELVRVEASVLRGLRS